MISVDSKNPDLVHVGELGYYQHKCCQCIKEEHWVLVVCCVRCYQVPAISNIQYYLVNSIFFYSLKKWSILGENAVSAKIIHLIKIIKVYKNTTIRNIHRSKSGKLNLGFQGLGWITSLVTTLRVKAPLRSDSSLQVWPLRIRWTPEISLTALTYYSRN